MKETSDNKLLNEIPDLTTFIINPLYQDVVDEIIFDSQELQAYCKDTLPECIFARLDDIGRGLVNGAVNRLIYYEDTTAFYQKYKTEINQLLYELLDGTGLSISELFGDNWDNADPLAIETQNQNLLAWFAYEEIASRLRDFLEQE